MKIFDEELLETFSLKAPMFEEELRELYKDAKKQATELFTKTCIGDDSVTYLDDLKSKFKQKFDQLKVENERAASTKAQAFL